MIDLIRLVCPQAHRLVSDNDQAQDAQKAKVNLLQTDVAKGISHYNTPCPIQFATFKACHLVSLP